MKDRLAKFMKNEGLSPSRFAEILGVPPSSISHLLAGRNKPGFDFLAKMTQRFPRLNPDWLLLGTGPIYRPTVGATMPAEIPITPTTPDTLSSAAANLVENRTDTFVPPDDLFGAFHEEVEEDGRDKSTYEPVCEPVVSKNIPKQAPRVVVEMFSKTAEAELPQVTPMKSAKSGSGEVAHIVICYADGTFEHLVPKSPKINPGN